jgi:solute carrier family 25, member 38
VHENSSDFGLILLTTPRPSKDVHSVVTTANSDAGDHLGIFYESEMSNGSNSKSTKKAHPTFHFAAGLASGVSSAVLLQPADLLKTRVQQSRSSALLPVLRSILSGPHPVTSLWRGTVPSALRTGFGSALYFTSLHTLRQLVANNTSKGIPTTISAGSSVLPKLSSTQNMLTGASARVFAGLILMPVTVIKVRYESDLYNYKSIFSASSNIYRTEGIRGFFTGFGATAVRDAPYAGLYVVFYEASKSFIFRWSSSTSAAAGSDSKPILSNPAINAASGVFAGITATTLTNPFDAVKTRLQLLPQKYGNMLKAITLMLKEDGIKSFFDGLGLRMGRKAISSALAWTVYEELIGRAEAWVVRQDEQATSAAI